ncbi:MAG: DUF6035 family protein [Candidatus Limisoma sp.]|nr:DUF6035 family protein [Candidatus Limisoma sp.]
MENKITIQTYFDNRDGQMIYRESAKLFNCDYDPINKDVRITFLSELRTAAKQKKAIDSRHTFLCGCCKRPLKIAGGNEGGKKCFHFMHIEIPPKGDCDYYEKVSFTKEEIKAMIFNGRTESLQHKRTKEIISNALKQEPSIKNVEIEKVAKHVGKTWRRPDIRAIFEDKRENSEEKRANIEDKTVVFEVQLSSIFHHVILERNDAYRDNGWYICWIFDDVNENNPKMRELDAWVNNNYNLFGFDDKAEEATAKSGRLHLTVKYYVFKVIEEGLNSRLGGTWQTETVQFSELTFDSNKMMAYLHDSGTEKQKCESRIQSIKKSINERQKVIDFIHNIPCWEFPSKMFERVLKHINQIDEEDVDLLFTSIIDNLRSFEADAINKWLKVVCEIVKSKGIEAQVAKYVWNEVIYTFERDKRKIDYLTLKDFLIVFGPRNYRSILNLLITPFDDETSTFLQSIKDDNEDFVYYAPLLILKRFFKAKRCIPERVAQFFAEKANEIKYLISAQQGKSFGYEGELNLKQITNLVCNRYHDIAPLFLYLIDRNGYESELSEVKKNYGKKPVNHHQRLKEVAEHSEQQPVYLTMEELDIMFPKNKAKPHQ